MCIRTHKIFRSMVWKMCFLLLITSCKSYGSVGKIGYLFDQIWMGTRILWSRKAISEVLADPELKQRYGEKLAQVESIKTFAKQYGLRIDSSYHTMVFPPDDQEVVSYLVVAAKPLSLEPLTHAFPFVGTLPYLGFFELQDRDEYAKKLEGEGYEVYRSTIGAFSLLGYLEDPIFPSMLKGDVSWISHLFMHELMHATVWKKGYPQFNEHLAEFVSITLTLEYLQKHNYLELYAKFRDYEYDMQLFNRWIAELKGKLREVYTDSQLSEKEKLQRKNQVFMQAGEDDNKPDFRSYNLIGAMSSWNNAKLALRDTYSFDSSLFSKSLECAAGELQEKMPVFLSAIQSKDFVEDQSTEEYLEELCEELMQMQ